LTKLIPIVVDAVAESDALPGDIRTLLKVSLPIVLSSDKADRHSYEAEVVAHAEKALATVKVDGQQKHKAALAKQNQVIAPAEHKNRMDKKNAAVAALEAAKAKVEASKQGKHNGQNAVHDAQSALKAAEKEFTSLEKEMQIHADEKAQLTSLLENEFVMLRDGSSAGAAGKKAVQKMVKSGKDYGADYTLLQTFPITCKKLPDQRSEFEQMMFTSLKASLDRSIASLSQKLAEAEPIKVQKGAAVASAKGTLERAEAALLAVSEELSTNQTAQKEAAKEVAKADAFLHQIWADMKAACDAQDALAEELKRLQDEVFASFEKLKERAPEPEPVEEATVTEEVATATVAQ